MGLTDEKLLNKAHFPVIGSSYCSSRGIIQKGALRLEEVFVALKVVQEQQQSVFIEAPT